MQVKRAFETSVKAPARLYLGIGAILAENALGHVIRPIDKKMGNKMIARTGTEAIESKYEEKSRRHKKKINDLHDDYHARPPAYYYGGGYVQQSAHQKEGPPVPLPQHGEGPSAPPQHHGEGPSTPPPHHD